MSLIGSMLGLLLVPMKMKPPTKREAELAEEVDRVTFALNHWRNAWHVLWAENERLQEERNRLRRANERLQKELKHETDFNLLHLRVRQAYEQQMADPARLQPFAETNAAFDRCTCIPSRSQVLGGNHGLAG